MIKSALKRPPRSVAVPLSLFSAAMVIAAIAPTDPSTHLTTTGYIHRYASMAGFVALPAAVLLLVRRRPDVPRKVAIWVRGLAIASTVFMLAMLTSATIGDRALIGLVERLLLGTGVVLLGVLAGWSARTAVSPQGAP